MKFESFTFLDQNGNMIDGITVVGESGTNYPVNVSIPEPSTLLLLGIGAISLLGYRKAKSHG